MPVWTGLSAEVVAVVVVYFGVYSETETGQMEVTVW